MDGLTIILMAILFFLLIALIYTLSTKKQANKTSINFKENKEATAKTSLELKEKIEEIYQKLKIGEEVNKTLLENVDKSIKEEIANQQKLFQEKREIQPGFRTSS